MKPSRGLALSVVLLVAGLLAASAAWAQVTAVDLAGTITDPQGKVVADAKVTVRNLATNLSRSKQSGDDGRYLFVGLAPGRYELSVEKAGFARVVNPEVVLAIGRVPELNVQLQVQAGAQQITVTGQAELVETERTSVSQTIESRQIDNLPINGRNYVNFTLLNSQSNRDNAPLIGAAPTSGLNFGGQRARSNEVSVDGADAVDNSVNGIRSTVSQEDVQEFQLLVSNYMPEFGRATGGVINIVTKSGSNDFHGDAFGFLRASDLQARNPFSFVGTFNPATDTVALKPVKQSYTRAQYGTAFGGPIQKDKTFYFFSFEGTRRHETGFSDIGADNFDGALPGTGLTPCQAQFVAGQAPTPGCPYNPAGLPPAVLNAYAALAGSASSVARQGIDPGLISGVPGQHFTLPVPCAPGTLTPIPCPASGLGLAPLPASFVPLKNLLGNYPVFEGTSIYAARIDHIWNPKNQTFIRGNVSPSLVTGIQVNAQNQSFGQNADSRTSLQQYRDWSIVAQHDTTISSNLLNEFRFQASRRGLHYGYSDCSAALCPTLGDLPGGSQVGVNLTGYGFFGREPFSPVDRIERRFQWTDHLSYVVGKHTLKFGVDTNLIQLRSNEQQIFELNFGGLYNFGSVSSSPIVSQLVGATVTGLPPLTAIQSYGLGLPQYFIQGTGESHLFFDNKTLGVFAQDSWRVTPRVTLNYGLRYDIEWTPTFAPYGGPNGVNAQAEKALGVTEGIPVFTNGVQPRVGLAWDPWGDGKTVIRAGGGLFYDHPLLAVAFDSTTADGARSTQLLDLGASPSACGIFPIGYPGYTPACPGTGDSPVNLNGSSLFQGVVNYTNVPTGFPYSIPYLPNQQRFVALPTKPQSVFVNENYLTAGFPSVALPFTLPTARNFVYGYATQGNLSIERELGHGYKISAAYSYTKGTHLNRPRNVNLANASLLDNNFLYAGAAHLSFGNPLAVTAPSANIAPAGIFCGASVIQPGVLAVLGGCPAGPFQNLNGQYIGTAAVFNFFRPSGPNPSFAGPSAVGYPGLLTLASLAGYPTGYFNASGAPIITPYSDVDQQESSGSSVYNGLTITVEKRWSQHFQFLANYTYSHAIDDSTDLQTLLVPQNSNAPQLERSNSTFDQRHRFVLSGVAQSPYTWKDGGWKALFGDWVVAPIFEAATGRPFTVLTGTDYGLQFSSTTNRPSVAKAGTPGGVVSPFISGVTFVLPNVCPSAPPGIPPAVFGALTATGSGCLGNLGRNTFFTPDFINFDLRISRKFKVTERLSVEVLADMFNLFNRFNVGDVNVLCDPATPTGVTATGTPACAAGQPTSAYDPRTFQFGLKIYW
jgi:hypothetical protein